MAKAAEAVGAAPPAGKQLCLEVLAESMDVKASKPWVDARPRIKRREDKLRNRYPAQVSGVALEPKSFGTRRRQGKPE